MDKFREQHSNWVKTLKPGANDNGNDRFNAFIGRIKMFRPVFLSLQKLLLKFHQAGWN